MTRKTLKKVKSQKKSKSQLRKTRKVRKHKGGNIFTEARARARASVPSVPSVPKSLVVPMQQKGSPVNHLSMGWRGFTNKT
jgi:hypothetical protein